MLLGAVVIVVVGILVVNYFRGLDTEDTLPVAETEVAEESNLPTTHTVAEGEDLWTISERYYESGYNWVDIAEANELSSPGNITVGQELTIPSVDAKVVGDELASAETNPTTTPEDSPNDESNMEDDTMSEEEQSDEADDAMMEADKSNNSEEITSDQEQTPNEITGDTYTVVHGDSLWTIAQRAYGDGNRWVDIAEANDLVNPSIIHSGNVFTLPR